MGLECCAVAKSQAERDESRRRSGTQMETGAETDEIKYLKKKKKKRREARGLWCFRSTGADVPADEHRGGLSETMTAIHQHKQSHLWKSSAHKTSSACKHQER